jgi:hypothetical protein
VKDFSLYAHQIESQSIAKEFEGNCDGSLLDVFLISTSDFRSILNVFLLFGSRDTSVLYVFLIFWGVSALFQTFFFSGTL